jgi:hypothetical protein
MPEWGKYSWSSIVGMVMFIFFLYTLFSCSILQYFGQFYSCFYVQ